MRVVQDPSHRNSGGFTSCNGSRVRRLGFARTRAPHGQRKLSAESENGSGRARGSEAKNAGASSPEGEGNWAKSTFEDLVQYNDGFKTNLIGTPQQIAERIVALKAVGVDLVLSGFLHFHEEVEYFGRKVLPLVRELEREADTAKTAALA